MQVHHAAQTRRRRSDFSPTEDTTIVRMYADGVGPDAIGKALDRPGQSVQNRIWILRRKGVIPGYAPRRQALETDTRSIRLDPPLTLRRDDRLVSRCLHEGGFPTAVVTSFGAVWAAPDGMPWRYGRPVSEVLL